MGSIGLTLGKFAPLHKGHEYLIECALNEVEQLVVLVYDAPEQTTIPVHKRAEWIQRKYPQVKVLLGVDGPTASGRSPEVMKIQEEYVRGMLGALRITHFYSSEFYGEHMSRALGAVDRRVDEHRSNVPVSASMVREDPLRHRTFVSDHVYRDLIINVVLLGAPSTGKSTLAAELARTHGTSWMPEYGREYWEAHQVDRRLTAEQLVEIAEKHIKREEQLLLGSDRYLFTDTNAMTTAIFAQHYHSEIHPRLVQLAAQCSARYDLVLVCDQDIPYDDTWDRSGDADRQLMQEKIIEDLERRNISYHIISGDLASRVNKVNALLPDAWKIKP